MNDSDNVDDKVLELAKIINPNWHDYFSKNSVKWPEPSYIFWQQRKEDSINLALKILNAGYSKEND